MIVALIPSVWSIESAFVGALLAGGISGIVCYILGRKVERQEWVANLSRAGRYRTIPVDISTAALVPVTQEQVLKSIGRVLLKDGDE